MIFLLGERIHSESEAVGIKNCGVCGKQQPFSHVIETNYFCLFGVRLLPIEKRANYLRCDQCNNSFASDNTREPTQVALVKHVLAYNQLGYGIFDRRDILQDICIKVTGFEFHEDEICKQRQEMEAGQIDLFQTFAASASGLNLQGKQQIIEASFLITHACCEIQYEDRLRINLIGNALGVSIEFVGSVIDAVHAQGCYGVRRMLATQLKQTD